jgi:hypothetical protein
MLDTTGPVSKEVVITTCLFLVILMMGTFTFDLYTRGDNTLVLTGATVADDTNKSNLITGGVVGITGAATAGSKNEDAEHIGTYQITPNTRIDDDHGIITTMEVLHGDIRLFQENVQLCVDAGEGLDTCLDVELKKEMYLSWLEGDDCETSEEALFYDVVDVFEQCLASADVDCLCSVKLSYRAAHTPGEYYFRFVQDGDDVVVELLDHHIGTVLSDFILLIQEEPALIEEMTLSVLTSGVVGSFSDWIPDNYLYLYKVEDRTLSVENFDSLYSKEGILDSCVIEETSVKKFCVQSETSVSVYEDGSVEKPVVYQFALSFE